MPGPTVRVGHSDPIGDKALRVTWELRLRVTSARLGLMIWRGARLRDRERLEERERLAPENYRHRHDLSLAGRVLRDAPTGTRDSTTQRVWAAG